MDVAGDAGESTVSTTSRWVAPDDMSDKAPQVCDQERQQVLERVSQTLTPPVSP